MQVHATHLLPMALTKELAVSSMPPLKGRGIFLGKRVVP